MTFETDFSFRIDFEKAARNPTRIFDTASELIHGFEQLDEVITDSIDAKLQPQLVLENVEAGSLRVILSSLLKRIDDQGLREGEYKKAIGPALVEAKYAAIRYLDKDQSSATVGAVELRDELRGIAATSNLRHLGDYTPIQEARLLAALGQIQNAKRLLGPKDKLLLDAPGRTEHEVDLNQTWDPPEVAAREVTTTEKQSEGEIILTIRRPDMTGQSKWQFMRGKSPLFAKISDEQWLRRFHEREVSGLHSGDAMRCKVKFIYVFDDKGTMLDEALEITTVLEIINNANGEQLEISI
ncbi:hypothetical protein IVA88_16710 [Bradyrhizobium sp. 149]|uniref:hypothetical protein n=1 Tax=Bradyrhizobium sp. 149 TaxID=2782624 RepID=UPI001FFA1602|nr:hypothetical protein [Bradyrhizobium sp. 149]MCK1653061.1 hypothetical protein [Bradyrhizobium sp. 149]